MTAESDREWERYRVSQIYGSQFEQKSNQIFYDLKINTKHIKRERKATYKLIQE